MKGGIRTPASAKAAIRRLPAEQSRQRRIGMGACSRLIPAQRQPCQAEEETQRTSGSAGTSPLRAERRPAMPGSTRPRRARRDRAWPVPARPASASACSSGSGRAFVEAAARRAAPPESNEAHSTSVPHDTRPRVAPAPALAAPRRTMTQDNPFVSAPMQEPGRQLPSRQRSSPGSRCPDDRRRPTARLALRQSRFDRVVRLDRETSRRGVVVPAAMEADLAPGGAGRRLSVLAGRGRSRRRAPRAGTESDASATGRRRQSALLGAARPCDATGSACGAAVRWRSWCAISWLSAPAFASLTFLGLGSKECEDYDPSADCRQRQLGGPPEWEHNDDDRSASSPYNPSHPGASQ